jgi:hypothetical protein
MNYKDIVHQIANLDWAKAVPGDIVLLSRCTAKEFAASLRLGLRLFPDDERLKEMAGGELKTDNMVFEDYIKITPISPRLKKAMAEYVTEVETLSDSDRAMTVFSREEELALIFEKIVVSQDWALSISASTSTT